MEKKERKNTGFFFSVEFDESEYKRNKLNNGTVGDKQDGEQ